MYELIGSAGPIDYFSGFPSDVRDGIQNECDAKMHQYPGRHAREMKRDAKGPVLVAVLFDLRGFVVSMIFYFYFLPRYLWNMTNIFLVG